MKRRWQFILWPGESAWQVLATDGAEVRFEPCPAPDEAGEAWAEAVRAQLAALGHEGAPLLLALPSPWCLASPVEETLAGEALAYELEARLPVPAESLVADVVAGGEPPRLAVAGRLELLAPALGALDAAGLVVRHAAPAALLAAAWLARAGESAAGAVAEGAAGPPRGLVLAWPDEAGDGADAGAAGGAAGGVAGAHDVIAWDGARPVDWAWFPAGDEAWGRRARALAEEGPVFMLGADRGTGPLARPVALEPPEAARAAALEGQRVLAGRTRPTVDLRRGPIAGPGRLAVYRREAQALAGAILLLIAALGGAAEWRARQYAAAGARAAEAETELFRTVLPGERPPASVRRRLLSEKRRLEGLGGAAAQQTLAEAVNPVSALVHLEAVLASFPETGVYRLRELRIGPEAVRLEGEARGYRQAERLAERLGETGRYVVGAPETRAAGEGRVRFTLTARPMERAAFEEEAP